MIDYSFCVAFASYVAYIIQREISLADALNPFSPENLVKNGYFGIAGLGKGEHLVPVEISIPGEPIECV